MKSRAANRLATRSTVFSLALAANLLLSGQARANCARPVGYDITVDGNAVTIRPVNFDGRGCPEQAGMLRQNLSSGEVVRLADFCASADQVPSDAGAAYRDECVPSGIYRYGFATPYDCESSSCSTSYYAEARVTAQIAADCARSAGNPGSSPAGGVPWSDSNTICEYGGNSPFCAASPGIRKAGTCVLGIQGLALVTGVVLMKRRRRRTIVPK